MSDRLGLKNFYTSMSLVSVPRNGHTRKFLAQYLFYVPDMLVRKGALCHVYQLLYPIPLH